MLCHYHYFSGNFQTLSRQGPSDTPRLDLKCRAAKTRPRVWRSPVVLPRVCMRPACACVLRNPSTGQTLAVGTVVPCELSHPTGLRGTAPLSLGRPLWGCLQLHPVWQSAHSKSSSSLRFSFSFTPGVQPHPWGVAFWCLNRSPGLRQGLFPWLQRVPGLRDLCSLTQLSRGT